MSRTNWKARERQAAAIVKGRRFPANQGGAVDVESADFCVQVKERRVFSLTQMETEAVEIDRVATQKNKCGVLMVKRSAGKGIETPWLFVLTEAQWRYLNGRLPTDLDRGRG